MIATDEEWRTGFAAYADFCRRKRGEVVGTFDDCMNDPVRKASIICLILQIRLRRAKHAAFQAFTARRISAPHQLGREPLKKKRSTLDRKMLAAGERDDDF